MKQGRPVFLDLFSFQIVVRSLGLRVSRRRKDVVLSWQKSAAMPGLLSSHPVVFEMCLKGVHRTARPEQGEPQGKHWAPWRDDHRAPYTTTTLRSEACMAVLHLTWRNIDKIRVKHTSLTLQYKVWCKTFRFKKPCDDVPCRTCGSME